MIALLSRLEIAVTVGVIGAVLLIAIARLVAPAREMLIYGVGLGFTASVYVLFDLLRGAPGANLGVELVGAVAYGGLAVLGVRRWPALLALGWTAHTAWDLFVHTAGGLTFAPAWYPLFCVGFDLVLGGYIAGLVAPRRPAACSARHFRRGLAA